MGGAATSSTNGCSHSHTASQLRLHMQSQTAREGERRGECEHQMCADHTLCMVCSHHPKSHTLTVTTPCRWHVNRQGGRRGREKRGRRGSSLIPSIAHPAGTHHPSSPSHTLPLFSSLSFTPTIHAHIITSTNLAPNPLHTTAPPTQPASPHTHTHTRPNPHPLHVPVHRGHAAAAAAAPLLAFLTTTTSSPCPPPPACHTCTHKQQVVHV